MNIDYHNLHPTGKKILKAATRVFVEKGYRGATTSEIAKEAGVAEGTIFKHFKTKKELFLSLFVPAIMEMTLPEVLDSLEELLEEEKNSPEEEVLKAIFKNRLELIRKNSDIIKLLFYEAQFHEEIRDLLLNKLALKARKIVMKYIDERKKVGILKRDIDSGVAARSLAALFMGHIVWHNFVSKYVPQDEVLDEEKDLDQVIRLFLYGMKA